MYSFLSKPPYEKPIENLKDLADTNMPLKYSDGMRVLFDENDAVAREILNRGSSLQNKTFVSYAYQAYYNNYATIIEEGVLVLEPNLAEALQMFELHSFIMCYYMPKNHILYDYFDKVVHTIIESGCMDKIISEMKFYYANIRYIFKNEENSRVSLNQIGMAFLLLILGYIISIFVFLMELFFCRSSL